MCVVCCTVQAKPKARKIKTKKEVWKKYKQRTREGLKKKNLRKSKICFFLRNVQTGSAAQPASYSVGPKG